MNIDELYYITEWVKTEIEGEKIPQKYQQLQSKLNQNSNPNQQKTSFDVEKQELLKSLDLLHTSELTNDQASFLAKLGISQLIGNSGIRSVEDILFRNSIDITTAAAKLAESIQILNEGIRKLNLISDGLDGLVEMDDDEDDENVLIRVSFLGNSSMTNVVDFKNWGRVWHEIGRGVAQAHNGAPEDVQIIGASKGSVIIVLSTAALIACTVSGIILSGLKVAEKVLDLKKKAAEVRILKLQEKKLAGEIEEAAKKEKASGIETIVAEQIKLLKLKKTTDGDKITALRKAIENLVNFVENGGEVDFITPIEETDEEGETVPDDFTLVRSQAEEIRKLEHHLKRIEGDIG